MRSINLLAALFLGLIVLRPAGAADDKACLGCHSMMQAMLSKSSVHPAMTLGCTTCHVDHTQSTAAAGETHYLKAAPAELCVTCHAEIVQKEFVHAPAKQDCTLCHNPHANLQEGLRAQSNALCLECHSDTGKAKFEADGPVKLFGGAVTAPSSYFQSLRLLSLPNDLGHPVSNHPVLRKGDAQWPALGCTTCHKPHGADKSKSFLVTESETFESLCQRCHQ